MNGYNLQSPRHSHILFCLELEIGASKQAASNKTRPYFKLNIIYLFFKCASVIFKWQVWVVTIRKCSCESRRFNYRLYSQLTNIPIYHECEISIIKRLYRLIFRLSITLSQMPLLYTFLHLELQQQFWKL